LPATQNPTAASKINMRPSPIWYRKLSHFVATSNKAQTLKEVDSILVAFCERLYCLFTIKPTVVRYPRPREKCRIRRSRLQEFLGFFACAGY
jgi:hypothetical protein